MRAAARPGGPGFAQALEAGKHVNSEVPAAHTIEDCWRLVGAWRELVAQGRLGRITYAEGQYIGYYGTRQFFQDYSTGEQYPVEELAVHPEARPTILHQMPPIHYLPHELSPMLKILDDRVVEVVAMSTGAPSYSHPEIGQPDIQAALMKTEKDAVLRLVTGFTQPGPHSDHHWYQLIGTAGRVEWRRAREDKPRMWLADADMEDMTGMDWGFERVDAPSEARSSGHGDADYYVHAAFREAVMHGRSLEFDVYGAVETAAPAILAADSIDQGSRSLRVPEFRPGPDRKVGQVPGESK